MKTIHPVALAQQRKIQRRPCQIVKAQAALHPTLHWSQIFKICIDNHPKTFIYFVKNQERFHTLFQTANGSQ